MAVLFAWVEIYVEYELFKVKSHRLLSTAFHCYDVILKVKER